MFHLRRDIFIHSFLLILTLNVLLDKAMESMRAHTRVVKFCIQKENKETKTTIDS